MPAELMSQGRQHFAGIGTVLPGLETGIEGSGQDVRRNVFFYGCLNRPPAFAGIADVTGEI